MKTWNELWTRTRRTAIVPITICSMDFYLQRQPLGRPNPDEEGQANKEGAGIARLA
jgi:hypothetical protein